MSYAGIFLIKSDPLKEWNQLQSSIMMIMMTISYSRQLQQNRHKVKILPGQFHDFPTPSHLSATRFWPKMLGLKKPSWNHHEPQLLGIVCRVPPSLDVVEHAYSSNQGMGGCIFFGASIFAMRPSFSFTVLMMAPIGSNRTIPAALRMGCDDSGHNCRKPSIMDVCSQSWLGQAIRGTRRIHTVFTRYSLINQIWSGIMYIFHPLVWWVALFQTSRMHSRCHWKQWRPWADLSVQPHHWSGGARQVWLWSGLVWKLDSPWYPQIHGKFMKIQWFLITVPIKIATNWAAPSARIHP